MIRRILPRYGGGTVRAIPSKSQAHRALICAALSGEPTRVQLEGSSGDIRVTVRALEALGARIDENGSLRVHPVLRPAGPVTVDCGESGSTLRFLLPVAAALGAEAEFTGHGRLPARPLGELRGEMERHGVLFSGEGLPLRIRGRMAGGDFFLPGNVSSQYVSGLLLALPLLGGGSVRPRGPLQSLDYARMTVEVLKAFGVPARAEGEAFLVPEGAVFRSPGTFAVEGDWSGAAAWLCAGALLAPTTVAGLDRGSVQGDRAAAELLERFGARVRRAGDRVTAAPGPLRGIDLDARDIPDLVPVLAVVAAAARGRSRIFGVRRLRMKESDRLEATLDLLSAHGCKASTDGEVLLIEGGGLAGAERTLTRADHRMVMAGALAALASGKETLLCDAESVDKSYPGFFEDLRALGGESHVL